MKSKIKNIAEDYRILLRSVPTMTVVLFTLSVVLMNLMANKIIFQVGNVAADGGFLVSWLCFLTLDVTCKRWGARASILLNLLGAAVNIGCVLLFLLVVIMPGNGEDFSAFNGIFGGVWFITLASVIAYIISGVANSLLNAFIGKLFKKNPDGKAAFFCRSYISTMAGQFVDNMIFGTIVYYVCAPIFWGWGLPLLTCVGTAVAGALLELLMEVIFSPIGYRMAKKWDEKKVGMAWLDKYPLR